MSSKLNPYLVFDGTAREAMEFYQSVIGGELQAMTFAEGGAGDFPGSDKIMHAALTNDRGWTLFASDTVPQMPHSFGDTVSVSISGDDEDLPQIFAALAEGGEQIVPFAKQMWGDEYGMVRDRFGVLWHINKIG